MRPPRYLACLSTVLVVLGIMVAGCAPLPSARRSLLRITNNGPFAAKNLTVLFPEDEVEFGDVPVGETTGYREVPHGVYRYAAYRVEIDGELVTQPVIDWVGERPMEGSTFTYVIDVDPSRAGWEVIRLSRVTKDD